MHKGEGGDGLETKRDVWLDDALHDLCQPLTALQCRLYLATMAARDVRAAEMEDAVRAGLQQCERTIVLVRAMQQRVYVRLEAGVEGEAA